MVPAWVDEYIGIPFKAMGRDRAGLGCWGMVWLVYREQFGRDVPAYAENHFTTNDSYEVGKLVAGEIVTKWVPVEPGTEVVGDAVLFRVGGWPSHIGVVVDPAEKKFLHSFLGTDSCVDRWDGPRWRRRLTGFYRFAPAPDEAA
jgi:cell wall-associated NlpC family hydrolase